MRQNTPRLAVLCLWLLGAVACSSKATVQDCAAPCERVAGLHVKLKKASALGGLHELEERVEATEKAAKANVERLEQELAEGAPTFDEQAVAKKHLPAKAAQGMREQHQWAATQLRVQRERAIEQAHASVVREKQVYAAAQLKVQAMLAKATTAAAAACVERCVSHSQAAAQCLLRTQAVEDVELCLAD